MINAIWNRLNRDIEIVTQQYIHNPKAKKKKDHYFIDLYFPYLNIGIECDEAHHLGEENKKADDERDASIYDALHEIGNKGYVSKRINVAIPNVQYKGYKAWFRAIVKETNVWDNQLLNEGKELTEHKKGVKLDRPNEKRIVFAKYEDPLRDRGYKFIGIFECYNLDKKRKRYYRRIEEKF